MKSSSVKLTNISKSFLTPRGKVEVLSEISLDILPGELFVLLGPSGCGKSTLLNLISGLEKPTKGQIVIGDTIAVDISQKIFTEPFERDTALVFQSYALYPHMTVRQNIAFPLTNLKKKLSRKSIDNRVMETARLLQIEELLERKPAELSGGQRQRVAIGRAIVRKPRLFLMDEPLSNLDARLRMDMRAQLKDLQRRLQITTIYVTHDQMEAMTLGDRIAVLQGGIIQQVGKPAEVYEQPANPFIAGFIGSPPMNLIEGSVIEENGKTALKSQDGTFALPKEAALKITISNKKSCIMGIRPENISLGNPGEGNIDVEINVVENIGSEYLAYIFLKNGNHIVVKSTQKPTANKASLIFKNDKILFFNS